jgi:hypothetical protein
VAPDVPLARVAVRADDEVDDRLSEVKEAVDSLVALGYEEPELDCEIPDPEDGQVLAVAEAFWSNGLQTGLGEPVILELDPAEPNLPRLEELGYQVFTSTAALEGFERRRAELASGDTPDNESVATTEESVELDSHGLAETHLTGDDLRRRFDREMRGVYERARSEAGYNATYFLSMLAEHGGLGTAHRLLAGRDISDGFSALRERRRVDLTVEALVLQTAYAELFSDEELETARRRLEDYGYHLSAQRGD